MCIKFYENLKVLSFKSISDFFKYKNLHTLEFPHLKKICTLVRKKFNNDDLQPFSELFP